MDQKHKQVTCLCNNDLSPQLVPRFLIEGGRPYLKPQGESVATVRLVQVALTAQKVQAEEAVVSPAFSHLKVRGKLPHNVLAGITGSLVYHLHSVLVPGVEDIAEH